MFFTTHPYYAGLLGFSLIPLGAFLNRARGGLLGDIIPIGTGLARIVYWALPLAALQWLIFGPIPSVVMFFCAWLSTVEGQQGALGIGGPREENARAVSLARMQLWGLTRTVPLLWAISVGALAWKLDQVGAPAFFEFFAELTTIQITLFVALIAFFTALVARETPSNYIAGWQLPASWYKFKGLGKGTDGRYESRDGAEWGEVFNGAILLPYAYAIMFAFASALL